MDSRDDAGSAATDETPVERWPQPQAGEKPKLEHAQAFCAGAPSFQAEKELSQPVEHRRLRMAGRTQTVAQFQGIGGVSGLAQIARKPQAGLLHIELLEKQQIRPRTFTQRRLPLGAHTQPSAKSSCTLARTAR
jgi:hypothetical protein